MKPVTSIDAKAGVLPVTPLPPRRNKRPEREHAVYVYGARHPEQPVCWLKQYAQDECAGQLEHAHLIPQQKLRKLGLGRYLGDAAVWETACRHHHFALDNFRGLTVPRSALSEETERFAATHGLLDFLNGRYGPRETS